MDHPAHALKCSLKMTAVLIFTCVLTSQVWCKYGPRSKAINKTIHQIRAEIQTSLGHLPTDELPSRVSCSPLNATELVGLDEQPHSGQALSLFRCHMEKLSNVTKELESQLLAINQRSQDVEELMSGSVSRSDCSLPFFEQDKDKYQFVHCLLELLDQVLSRIQP